jgi:hypothetical protein
MHGSLLCLSCCRSSESACYCFARALFILCLDNLEFNKKVIKYHQEFKDDDDDVNTYNNYNDKYNTLDEAKDFVTNYYESKFTKFNIY